MKRLVRLDSVAKHSREWRGVDILIFESYVWWMYKPTINTTYVSPVQVAYFCCLLFIYKWALLSRYGSLENIQEINVTAAYRVALETWANWLDSTINPLKQKIFFVAMSPTHLWWALFTKYNNKYNRVTVSFLCRSWEWKPGTDGNCFNETHPIEGSSYWGTGSSLDIMGIVEDVLAKLTVNVTVLNITQLSELRKDGHPSIFGERKGKLLTQEQRSDPKNYADCIHWCLPGVPDTWNGILYALLLQDYRTRWQVQLKRQLHLLCSTLPYEHNAHEMNSKHLRLRRKEKRQHSQFFCVMMYALSKLSHIAFESVWWMALLKICLISCWILKAVLLNHMIRIAN